MQPRSPRISVLDDVGDRDAVPGSKPWARWFVIRARQRREELDSEVAALQELLDKLEKHQAWIALGYMSLGMLSEAELDLTREELDRIRQAKPTDPLRSVLNPNSGPVPGSMTKAARANAPIIVNNKNRFTPSEMGSTNASYLKERLRNHHPDILRRLEAGEFPSVRAAALEAGIVQPSFQCPADPLKASGRLLRHFNGEALTTLLTELATHAGFTLHRKPN